MKLGGSDEMADGDSGGLKWSKRFLLRPENSMIFQKDFLLDD